MATPTKDETYKIYLDQLNTYLDDIHKANDFGDEDGDPLMLWEWEPVEAPFMSIYYLEDGQERSWMCSDNIATIVKVLSAVLNEWGFVDPGVQPLVYDEPKNIYNRKVKLSDYYIQGTRGVNNGVFTTGSIDDIRISFGQNTPTREEMKTMVGDIVEKQKRIAEAMTETKENPEVPGDIDVIVVNNEE